MRVIFTCLQIWHFKKHRVWMCCCFLSYFYDILVESDHVIFFLFGKLSKADNNNNTNNDEEQIRITKTEEKRRETKQCHVTVAIDNPGDKQSLAKYWHS